VSEKDVSAACIGPAVAGAIGSACSDDEIIKAIPIYVSRSGHRGCGVACILAADGETTNASCDIRQKYICHLSSPADFLTIPYVSLMRHPRPLHGQRAAPGRQVTALNQISVP
jgi:hypothetical protein